MQPSRGALLKLLHKSFKNSLKFDLKFKQKPWKINVKDFILCSVARTIRLFGIPFHAQANCFQFAEHFPR